MTNQEAIELIKVAQAEVEWSCPMDYATAFDLAIKALEQKWIPVSERLPEEDGFYLITDNYNRVVEYVFHKDGNSEEYWKRTAKAWMPLPEPYEPQEGVSK